MVMTMKVRAGLPRRLRAVQCALCDECAVRAGEARSTPRQQARQQWQLERGPLANSGSSRLQRMTKDPGLLVTPSAPRLPPVSLTGCDFHRCAHSRREARRRGTATCVSNVHIQLRLSFGKPIKLSTVI